MTLEEALKTGNETARFCLYGKDGPANFTAAHADELLKRGGWFRTPGEAENVAREDANMAAIWGKHRPIDPEPTAPPPKPPDRAKAIKRAVKSKKKVKR